MIPPTPTTASGSQTSPVSGNSFPLASGSSSAALLASPQPSFGLNTDSNTLATQDLATATRALRETLREDPDRQSRLDEVLVALRAHEQGNKDAPAELLEAVSQLWQRQPQDPIALEQLQQFLFGLQKELAIQPKSEPLIAQIRSLQEMRPIPLRQGATLAVGELQQQAPHQLGKLANGAPLAPLQLQSLLTQPQTDAQLLSLLSTAAFNGDQLTEMTALAQIRQTQIPVATGSLERSMPGTGGHEFSPLTLGKQPSLWAEQMLAPLTDRLRIQGQLGVKQATLRLDPPELGKLDLQVRTEGDRVFIQIAATNPTVRDQLLQLTDKLRQEILLGGGYAQVDVEVGQHGDERRGDGLFEQQEQEIILSSESLGGSERHSGTTSDYRVDTYV